MNFCLSFITKILLINLSFAHYSSKISSEECVRNCTKCPADLSCPSSFLLNQLFDGIFYSNYVFNTSDIPYSFRARFLASSDRVSYQLCPNECSACTASTYQSCTVCNPQFYFFALTAAQTGQCLNECPSGYKVVSNTCVHESDLVVSLDLTNKIILDRIDKFNVGWNTADIYPSYDSNDAFPVYKRGYYFNTNSYLLSESNYMVAPTFTISIWIKPVVAGIVMVKRPFGFENVRITVDSSGYPSLYLKFADSSSKILTGSTSIFNSWHYLCFTGEIKDGKTLLVLYYDTIMANTLTTEALTYLKDQHAGPLIIGTDKNSDIVFQGFLSRLNIYNSKNNVADDYTTSSCSPECSACPSNNQCLSDCGLNEYPDSCDSCLPGCSKGCIDNLSCKLCKYKECKTCNSFTEECTSCISNASIINGHCSCPDNFGWDSSSDTCRSCHPACLTCSTVNFDGCLTCKSGNFLIQSLCTPFCPTGFIRNSINCDRHPTYTSFLVLDLQPHKIKNIVVDEASNIPVLTGKNNKFYPTYDITDPIPAINRGYFFTGSSYMQLPPYTDTPSPFFTFSPKFMISAWIKPITMSGVIFSKQESGTFKKFVSLELNNKFLSLNIVLKDSTKITYESPTQLIESQWNSIYAISYISNTPKQAISIIINGVNNYSGNIKSSWFIDLENLFFITIGACYFDISTMASYFKGFLWDLKIYNAVIPIPAAPNNYLDNCLIDSYWNGNSCASCSIGCLKKGCVRSDKNCNLCQDIICEICDDYTTPCIICKANASLIDNSCQCNFGYYWSNDNEICNLCDTSCKTCTSPNYFDCLTCYNGNYMFSGICVASCPSGYSPSSGICVFVKEKIVDLDLNTLNGVIYDKASSIPVVTGSTQQFYPDYEIDDPIPAYLRGFYFNGQSSVLRLPEYSNYISPRLVIAPNFTISIWLNIENINSAILSKYSIIDNYSTLYSISLLEAKPAILMKIGPSPFFYLYQKSLDSYKWSHIMFTLENNNGYSEFLSYIDGVADSSITAGYGAFLDVDHHTSMTIGAQIDSSTVYNFYQGFIYSIQIFNAVKPISSLSTTSCTESCCVCPISQVCIPNCKINEYWSGPAYNLCYQCNIKCKKSCRDWRSTCSLCRNFLCETCTDYSNCESCKEHAINIDSCICDKNYVLDTPNSSTCIPIEPGGFKGDDGHFYPCPSLCSACESLSKCTACVNNASLNNDLCYCKLGYNGTISCGLVSFIAKLTVSPENSLYLIFSESLSKALTTSDFILKINNEGYVSSKMEQINSTYYYISLKLDLEISKTTLITLKFLDLTKMVSISNGILNSTEISASLNSYDPVSYSPEITSATSQATIITQVTVSVISALSIVNPNPSSLWSIMNTLQILSYLTLSGIPFSCKMRAFLNNLNSFSLFPNILVYFIDKNEGNSPYPQAKEFGFDTDLILINQGNDFTLILGSITILPIIFFFSRCSYWWLGNKFKKILKAYKYSVFLRFWIQCYLELGAAASIGLISFEFKNITQITNFIICAAIYFLLIITPAEYFWLSNKCKNRILSHEKTFFSMFDTLFYDFRTDEGLITTQYYCLFFARRLIYIINLVYLGDYPKTEVAINIVLSLMTTIFLAFYSPFKDKILQLTNLITEILIFLIMSSTTVYLFSFKQEIIKGTEYSIILTILAVMAIQTFSSIAIFSRILYQIVKQKLIKEGISKKRIHHEITISKVELK